MLEIAFDNELTNRADAKLVSAEKILPAVPVDNSLRLDRLRMNN